MKKTAKIVLIVGAAALGATAAYAAAPAQQQTPKTWSWTKGKDGKRVERPSEVTKNPDGSTREVIRNGKCTTIKERSASGEYRETRQCEPS
jgi:hypothetical protein